ncbi:MAG: sigma-54-dependent Fis family transcriptional regulator [Myxococcales bacterium]|nr:sigma-54-dependent Fis family transcriptional regulator [Myxococcales bacterium]
MRATGHSRDRTGSSLDRSPSASGGDAGAIPTVALVDVPDPVADVLSRAARGVGARIVVIDPAGATFGRGCADAATIVMGIVGAREASLRRARKLTRSAPHAALVVVGHGLDADRAVALMRAGASDVVSLPRDSREVVERCVGRKAPAAAAAPSGLIGTGFAMLRLREDVATVGPTDASVLITGETGVGKGLVARELHRISKRSPEPFVAVNCAALAPSVIESELFGHERGAFTGAIERRIGCFERAERGTIFLDEIADLPLAQQAKLLRVLQEREYERVGGSKTKHMGARVIAATNRDLRAAVAAGGFRADLMYRLEVFHIRVPPLRERVSDIRDLVETGVADAASRLGCRPFEVPAEFLHTLESRTWPGNVRELNNLLERLLIRSRGRVVDISAIGDAGLGLDTGPNGRRAIASENAASPREGVKRAERESIASALASARGNVAKAARALGWPRSTLRYRMRIHTL